MTGVPNPEMRITLATKVTLLRILGIPVFILLVMYFEMSIQEGRPNGYFRFAALVMFLAICLTDALDGFLARSRGEVTVLGRILDPIADKALLLSAILVLTRPSQPAFQPQLPVWFAMAIVSRDVILVAGAFLVRHFTGGVHIHPRFTGKTATTLQMATVVWVLMDGASRILPWLAGAAALLTVVSGLQYIVDGLRQLQHGHPVPRK